MALLTLLLSSNITSVRSCGGSKFGSRYLKYFIIHPQNRNYSIERMSESAERKYNQYLDEEVKPFKVPTTLGKGVNFDRNELKK